MTRKANREYERDCLGLKAAADHLVVFGFAASLLHLLCFLLFFGLGGSAPGPVGPPLGLLLVGPHGGAQPVVGRFALLMKVGAPDGARRVSGTAGQRHYRGSWELWRSSRDPQLS